MLQLAVLPPAAVAAVPETRPVTVLAPAAVSRECAAPDQPVCVPPSLALHLEGDLGIVVLQFRDMFGTIRSIPSEREQRAYRDAAQGVTSGAALAGTVQRDAPPRPAAAEDRPATPAAASVPGAPDDGAAEPAPAAAAGPQPAAAASAAPSAQAASATAGLPKDI